MILRAYQERASMRGMERIFGTVRQTLARWIREKAANLPAMETTSWLLSQTTCWIWMSYGHFFARKAQPTLGLDCPLLSHPPGRRLLHRRPQRRQVPGFAPSHPPKLQLSLFLQRTIFRVELCRQTVFQISAVWRRYRPEQGKEDVHNGAMKSKAKRGTPGMDCREVVMDCS